MIVRKATLKDLKYIESLSKKESKAIGFIPKVRYEAAILGKRIHEKTQPTCNDRIYVCSENSDLVGFVLGSKGNAGGLAKIAQIAIQEDARLITRGKALLNALIEHRESKGIYSFHCGCADDLESNLFWRAMGWKQVAQRHGMHYTNTSKEVSDRLVNIYHFESDNDPQLKLFKKERLCS
ncbi:GNAT family N-acetyltransferase [Thermodesulfobacteriota bacterium]